MWVFDLAGKRSLLCFCTEGKEDTQSGIDSVAGLGGDIEFVELG